MLSAIWLYWNDFGGEVRLFVAFFAAVAVVWVLRAIAAGVQKLMRRKLANNAFPLISQATTL
jgi:hypothetical protein